MFQDNVTVTLHFTIDPDDLYTIGEGQIQALILTDINYGQADRSNLPGYPTINVQHHHELVKEELAYLIPGR